MDISKRDIEKMLDYYSKGSRPEVLARTVKDVNKAMSRAVIANAMGWKGCSKAFKNRSKELGATYADMAEVERMCDTYELPDEYKSQFDNGPKLEDVSRLRDWFPKLFKVLRDHKVQNIKLKTREPSRDELEKDSRNGRCWTIAYTVSFDHNGKHYDWDIANHTNEGGGSYGVSAKSPLFVYQGTQQELADSAARVLDSANESISSITTAILNGTPVREALLSSIDLKSMNEDDQEFGGLIGSQHLKESRKFVKGEKFTFKDKYGSNHECTVLDKELFDEMDYDDYAIGTITFSYPTLGKSHEETVRILKSEQGDSYGDEYFVSDRKNGIANWVFPKRK